MKPAILLTVMIVIAVSGCTVPGEVDKEQVRATTACVLLCKLAAEQGRDLSAGPCLADQLQEGWVCDVAHAPRLPVDDLSANQCPSFGATASHFVEVDEYCDVIRAV
ncbi:MAG: hypothetical protein HY369_03855 [Candidatus Aenigmarchaeota archaeon]|nr:hypothetical protein [Candidatus Aenigmarchaeota archaeon]